MLTEETNKELKTAPANPEAEIANEESAPEETGKGNWREAFLSAFQTARRQQKPAESRQELGRDKSKSLFSARGSLRGAVAAFLRHLLASEAKDFTPWRKPARRSQSGPQSYTGTGEQRSHQIGDSDAECGCAFPRSSAGWPINAGRYRPDLANRDGAQTNCSARPRQAPAGLRAEQGRFL